MKNGNLISEEVTKSENDYKIKPTKNNAFLYKKVIKLKKNNFSNIPLKQSFEQRKDSLFLEKSFIKKDNVIYLLRNNNAPKDSIKINPIKIGSKILKKFMKEKKEKENYNFISKLGRNINIVHFLHNISFLKKHKCYINRNLDNNLSFNKSENNNFKKKSVLKNLDYIPKLPYKTIKLKKRKIIKDDIIYNKSSDVDSNLSISKILESKNFNQSIDNESIILTNKSIIKRIKFSSYENKIKYLFSKLKNNRINTIEEYSYKKNKNIKYNNVDDDYRRNKGSYISKLNRIIYNIGEKNNLSLYTPKKSNSFLKEVKRPFNENDSSSITNYRKIIINNKFKKPINYRLHSLRFSLIKENHKSILNISKDSKEISQSVPNNADN